MTKTRECSTDRCHYSRSRMRSVHSNRWSVLHVSYCVSSNDRYSWPCVTYLGLPVPLGASGDEKSPSITVTGDPAGPMPADTHLLEVFFEGATPCLLSLPHLSSAVFWHPVYCCMGVFLSLPSEDVATHFPSCNNVFFFFLYQCRAAFSAT